MSAFNRLAAWVGKKPSRWFLVRPSRLDGCLDFLIGDGGDAAVITMTQTMVEDVAVDLAGELLIEAKSLLATGDLSFGDDLVN